MLKIIDGMMYVPLTRPIIPPVKVAIPENNKYFRTIEELENPNDFKVPISIRSSSTILFIEIKLTRIATAKKTVGNIFDNPELLEV